MNRTSTAAIALAAFMTVGSAASYAGEARIVGANFGKLDHVFFIMMENETNSDILGNTSAPFINAYAHLANQATNYYAVGHPSAPNYLEVTSGSNFGVSNDYWPNWTGTGCIDNSPGSTGCNNAINPISVSGLDNGVVATATNSSQCNGQVSITGTPVANNCALYTYAPAYFSAKSIADQLVARNMSWKSYQESLPDVAPGVAGVNYSDGSYSNLSPVSVFAPGPIQKLYAVKHDPFVYFRNVQVGTNPAMSLARVVDFDGPDGFWSDLRSNKAPNFSFIVPNQCNDMHGFVSGGTPICSAATAAETALLIQQGDAEVNKIITGIKASPAWFNGRNAIVLVWDENDYSNAANTVVMTVETNYAPNGQTFTTPVDHFSLLKTLEAGFGLPCLNHACDATSVVMNTMFGGH
jgi:hypothetical protein